MTNTCPTCQKLPKHGTQSYCAPCMRSYHREKQRSRYKTCPEYRERKKDFNRKHQYGLEPGEYARMEERSNGCEICGACCPTGRRLSVDHCHMSGKVRGLLCANCNRALGLMLDDPGLLRAAADYLEYHGP